jgi:hypothetical protein
LQPIDQRFWEDLGVNLVDMPLDAYVAALSSRLDALTRA